VGLLASAKRASRANARVARNDDFPGQLTEVRAQIIPARGTMKPANWKWRSRPTGGGRSWRSICSRT